MKNSIFTFSMIFGVLVSSILAQPTRQQMEAITMPPPRYDVTTTLDYNGDYGYYYVGSEREFTNTENLGDPNKWYWVRYKNPGNTRNIWAWVSMGTSGVCSHGHLSYGVWGKWQYNFGFSKVSGWSRLGMGTKSGDSQPYSCVWDVNNSLTSISQDFGWGDNYVNRNISGVGSYFRYTEYVVGGITVSHGGYCASPYNHCGHKIYSVLYSLPY